MLAFLMDDLLSLLNPEQRRAVEHVRGPVLVLAGAGSGKTRVITCRLAHLVRSGEDPARIAAVTFTNKAAAEMRERAERLLAGGSLGSFVGTFHAWGLRFLRRHAAAAGLPGRFSILDTADQLALVKEAMEQLDLPEKMLPARSALSRISGAKNELKTPEEFVSAESDFTGSLIARIFALYEKRLREAGAVDFDDMIVKTVRLLREQPELREAERARVRHLLIDEYQDTNRAQDALVKLLGEGASSLCAVGDEDQAIYRWRGAEVEHILRFEEDFPGAAVISLVRNYRSTSKILEAAGGVVAHNARRRGKVLRAERPGGERVRLFAFGDDREEAAACVGEIASGRRPHSDWAVLFRTNAQSRSFEDELVRKRIPYAVVGGLRFYERAEVKDALAYMRLAVRPEDDLAFRRVVNVPARGIGAATLEKIAAAARQRSVSLWEASADAAGLAERARIALSEFRRIVSEAAERAPVSTPSALLEWLLGQTGYAALYENSSTHEDVSRRENLRELVSAAREFESRADEGATAASFLDAVGLATDADAPRPEGSVTLLTLHAAKGLEFSAVWIAGLEEGFLPHAQSGSDEDEIEEERRLLYVGMTRARDELSLSFCRRRLLYGETHRRSASRFLSEIPDSAVVEIEIEPEPALSAAGGFSGSRRQGGSDGAFEAVLPAADAAGALRRGRRVRHPRYGAGVILSQEGSGEQTRVVVYFDRAGKKKFVARFANLEPE
jgi:ATP-dependent DNA helicase UvrD/PcrA